MEKFEGKIQQNSFQSKMKLNGEAMILKNRFVEWSKVTTCAGIIDIVRAKSSFSRFSWFFVVSIMLILTIWQTYELFRDFILDNPFQTSMSIASEEVVPFPNITICNFNRINKLKSGPLDKDALTYAFSSSLLPYVFNSRVPVLNSSKYKEAWMKMSQELNITNAVELYDMFGNSCVETIIACSFSNYFFNCCRDVYEPITPFGKCFMPKISNNAGQIIAGNTEGFKMIINPLLHAYTEGVAVNNFWETGMLVLVDYVETALPPNFISVSPGSHVWLSLSANLKKFKRYSTPLRSIPCTKKGHFVYLSVPYSRENCKTECVLRQLYSACGCSPVFPIKSEFRFCTPVEMENCILPITNYYFIMSEDLNWYITNLINCTKQCMDSCDPHWDIKFEVTSSTAIGKHVADEVLSIFKQLYSATFDFVQNYDISLADSVIVIDAFFPRTDYVEIETGERYPIFAFIGNVGGQLGLWLGLTIFTLVQFFFYLVSCLFCIGST